METEQEITVTEPYEIHSEWRVTIARRIPDILWDTDSVEFMSEKEAWLYYDKARTFYENYAKN